MPGRAWDVLVVDDEPVVAAGMRRILEQEGLAVATAGDVAAALAHPAVRTCRLALCDLVLPDGSGIDLIRTLWARRPGLPIVLVTGYVTAGQRELALRSGAAAFLAKPFDEAELLETVRGVLDLSGAAAEEKRP
jgi:DNA-binding NtrC family response regulator